MTLDDTSRHILCYSGHAVRRMMERGISVQQAEQTLEHGVLVVERKGTGTWARGRLRVVVSRGGMVITAWREKRNNPKRTIQKMKAQRRKLFRGR